MCDDAPVSAGHSEGIALPRRSLVKAAVSTISSSGSESEIDSAEVLVLDSTLAL